jgi:hypothetical protein
VPGYETAAGATLERVDELSSRLGVGRTVQRQIDQDIGIDENVHRYFSARRRKRSSERSALRSLPRHRFAKEGRLASLKSRRASSINWDNETPRERANPLALGTRSSSMVTVSFVFTPASVYVYQG